MNVQPETRNKDTVILVKNTDRRTNKLTEKKIKFLNIPNPYALHLKLVKDRFGAFWTLLLCKKKKSRSDYSRRVISMINVFSGAISVHTFNPKLIGHKTKF